MTANIISRAELDALALEIRKPMFEVQNPRRWFIVKGKGCEVAVSMPCEPYADQYVAGPFTDREDALEIINRNAQRKQRWHLVRSLCTAVAVVTIGGWIWLRVTL